MMNKGGKPTVQRGSEWRTAIAGKMEVKKPRAGALRTPFLGPESAQTRSRRRVLRARSTAVQAGASQSVREREGEREGESLHGEILNRDP